MLDTGDVWFCLCGAYSLAKVVDNNHGNKYINKIIPVSRKCYKRDYLGAMKNNNRDDIEGWRGILLFKT